MVRSGASPALLVATLSVYAGAYLVEVFRSGLDAVPRAAKVFAPEAIVLGPAELVDVEVGQERAFDARAPDKLRDRERVHRGRRAGGLR